MDTDTFLASHGLTTDHVVQPSSADFTSGFLASHGLTSQGKDDVTSQLTGQIWPDFETVATQIAKDRSFPIQILLGQAAFESGRGTSGLTMQDQNYFGIKAHGNYGSQSWDTQEADSGGNYHTENDAFAKYSSPQQSINDYIDLVTSYPGVKEAIATGNPAAVLQAIKNAGYATSPTYVQDVMNTPEFKGGQ